MTTVTENLSNLRLIQEDDFDALFLAHYDRIYGLLYRLVGTRSEAEDLAQEVFLKLYQTPPRRRPDNNVSAWLYRVATNTAYNAVRNRTRRWRRNWFWLPEAQESDDPAYQVERNAEVEAVRQALWRLKPEQAQLLLLRQMGLSYAELAQACNLSPASVGQLLARAAEAFRRAYLAAGGEEK